MERPSPWDEPVTSAALPASENVLMFQLQQGKEIVLSDRAPERFRQGVHAGGFGSIGAPQRDEGSVDVGDVDAGAGGQDGAVLLWYTAPQAWGELACGRINRDVTAAEWEQYIN